MKRLQEVLICPNTIQFHAPAFQADETLMELQERCAKANNGHGVIVRAHPMRLVSVVATMASIVLEKWRVRLEYELTPLPIEAEQVRAPAMPHPCPCPRAIARASRTQSSAQSAQSRRSPATLRSPRPRAPALHSTATCHVTSLVT